MAGRYGRLYTAHLHHSNCATANNVEETAVLEPQFVLDEISQAINHAEANLSKNNFAIASGQVETSVIMGNEKGERIQAKITFQIAPQTPQ